MEENMTALDKLFTRKKPVVPIRAVHLDLKGVPPTPGRLVGLLDVFSAFGYNAVVVEWEDTFPWTADKRIRCETAYTPEDVRALHMRAAELGIEIIPLVQCLGHLQFVLKLPGYKAMREVPDGIDVINPLADGAGELIGRLVDDVLALTGEVKRFHLGGDEAWSFGKHPDTKAFIARHGKGALYIKHIEPILDKLNAAGIRPMLWHDMMRDWDSEALRRLGEKADLVLWAYRGNPLTEGGEHVNESMARRFAEHGIGLWGASAYKGADGYSADLPSYDIRQANAQGWADAAGKIGVKGVIATAWSRYTHCMCQCEPIDAALDSLGCHGVVLHEGSPPGGGREAVLAGLEAIGERERFEKCRAAMADLAAYRKDGWFMVQMGREEVVTIVNDKRRAEQTAVRTLARLKAHVARGQEVAEQVREAFVGQIDPLWVHRYLAERIDPFRTETMQLEELVKAAEL